MEVATGKSILKGIAIGRMHVFKSEGDAVQKESELSQPEEWKRFQTAVEKAQAQLRDLYDKALEEVGEEQAAIFDVHQQLLEDEDYTDAVKNIIATQGATAEYATQTTGANFAKTFASMEDEYFRARSADIEDISRRVVNILTGREDSIESDEPFILVADDLTPSQTVSLDKSKLLGFVTRYGSSNSHTAILARTMNIPALIGVDINDSWDGQMGIIDGYNACVYADPTDELLKAMEEKHANDVEQTALLQKLKNKPNQTLDGKEIKVYANIGNVADVGLVLQNDAQGIGLFRSEFIYLEAPDFPTEDEQFEVYKQVAETMGGKQVIIRTLDLGADKQAPYFKLTKEENPALGLRAIRISLTRPDLFKTQLRAILRASAFGMVSLMFPMIISVDEVRRAKAILEECKQELKDEGQSFSAVQVGIMIETPASVMIADELAQEVDFFSMGTNDLTQYTLAIDRQNAELDDFYDPHHPAILRMIKHVVDAAHRHGIWAGICGELGADLDLTETFLRMGVDELSVSPGAVLPLRHEIRNLDLQQEIKSDLAKEFEDLF
ncbi:MAG: phosphoenolpyruvate--protein phosphotransferase [Clostridia bacterium]|nr:phosphoenolpyruvate--protein phosphotransferase [Clostridia bacterium]